MAFPRTNFLAKPFFTVLLINSSTVFIYLF